MTTVPATTTTSTIAPVTRARAEVASAVVGITSAAATAHPTMATITRENRPPREHSTVRNFDHESLWSLCCRRLSFAMYRGTTRYHRQLIVAPQRGLAEHVLPVPLLSNTIAVYLSSHLPVWMVARLGHGGLIRAGQLMESVAKASGSAARLVLTPLFAAFRWVRSRTSAASGAAAHAEHQTRFLIDAPDGQPLNMLLDARVMVSAVRFSPSAVYLSLRSRKQITAPIQIFAHAYPEDAATLPADRRSQGFFCKDHNPYVDPSRWPRNKWYRDEIWLADLPAGYYRIEVGIIERGTFRKYPVSGTTRTSIDLGWVRIGAPEGNQ